jgi:GR25 family glycosyltransferase involved in LPS biosynthesis
MLFWSDGDVWIRMQVAEAYPSIRRRGKRKPGTSGTSIPHSFLNQVAGALGLPKLVEAAKKFASPMKVLDEQQWVPSSFLHEVVGAHGVLQITLDRDPLRASYSAKQLQQVGIFPTRFVATDGWCAPWHILQEACNENCSPEEAAVAHSHKRALEVAAMRSEEWTAILEDDAVPFLPEGATGREWDAALQSIWAQVPETAKIVRLNWCQPISEDWSLQWMNSSGEDRFKLTQFAVQNAKESIWNSVGLCTTAYLVRKDMVRDLLSIFPCNCAVDCCYGWKFFNGYDVDRNPYSSFLYNLDMDGSTLFGDQMNWYGILRPAQEKLGSTIRIRSR